MAEQDKEYGENELRALLSGPAVGVPHHATEQERITHSDRRMAQREAYGQFVADGDIYWPGTGILVFTEGQPVPMEHVEKWLLEEAKLVHRVASPRLARAGARFPAKDGGQVTGGDSTAEAAPHLEPAMTPPAPSGEQAAKDDQGGTTESKPRGSKRAAADKEGN